MSTLGSGTNLTRSKNKMIIYGSKKVVTTWALVDCTVGEFRVYPNGKINRWDDELYEYVDYPSYEEHYDEILAIGMGVLK